jgi:hypothetical protein
MSSIDPTGSDLTGVARDAETISDVLHELDQLGYSSQFMPREREAGVQPTGDVMCATCHQASHAASMPVLELRRLEGASDPDDMLVIGALECPNCAARGTLVLPYGPQATAEEDTILGALTVSERPPHLPEAQRVHARADALQPEEQRAGTENAEAQAEAILTESDARIVAPTELTGSTDGLERRRSEDTVDGTA